MITASMPLETFWDSMPLDDIETFWDVRQRLKLLVADHENPEICHCREILEKDKPYFPYLLPASCFLEKRPYSKDCQVKNCLYKARLFKVVNLKYELASASINESIVGHHKDIPQVLERQARVYLCLQHFERNYEHCCLKCSKERFEKKSQKN